MSNVSFTGYSLPIDTFTNSSYVNASSSGGNTVYLSSLADTDKVTLKANIPSSSAVKYKVDVLNFNAGTQNWYSTGSGNYETSAPTIGTKKELLDRTASKGYTVYRITTQYYVYGPDNANGKRVSDISYVKVKFVK